MKLDENKRYTNREIIQALNQVQKNLASELGTLGKMFIKLQTTVNDLVDYRKKIVWREEYDKELALKRGKEDDSDKTWVPIVKKLLEVTLYALILAGIGMGIKLAS